jgi:hypothetical protein
MAYVSAILRGGFANRLFIIHVAQNYAQKTNRTFVLIDKYIHDNAHETKELTQKSLESLFGEFILYKNKDYNTWKFINDPQQFGFKSQNLKPHYGQSVIFDGYFQCESYFLTIQPSIHINNSKPHTYFIHIRLGDYVGNKLYELPLKSYYNEAIMQITENDIEAKFLVFSNDNTKAEQYIQTHIKVPFDYTFSKAETALETLQEMASCAGAICANSSLSWMGAFYQSNPNKQVYMPRPWINTSEPLEVYPDWAKVIDL